jgi:hypothetical protein
VMAGIRKRNTQGAIKNKGSSDAYPPSRIFILLWNHQRMHPLPHKKTITTR